MIAAASRDAARPSLLDRGFALRDRLLASPQFRRWGARFPLTRFVARRRARALFDLCAGFVYSQILLACVKSRLCEILFEGPQSIDELARRLALPRDSTLCLLDAAAALGLAARRSGGRFGLGPLGAALIGNPAVIAMVEHHALLYQDLRDPLALLRGELPRTALADYWPYARRAQAAALTDADVAPYSALMAASQSLIATEVLDAYPLQGHRCLLDVGGGEGAFAIAAAARAPDLRLILFDLPAVAARARARFASERLADRAVAVGGSFFVDSLPAGADVASLIRVVHDHDDAGALAILSAVRKALPAGGTLLLAEPMAGPDGSNAYFAFYLKALGQGLPRTPERLMQLLHEAGFTAAKVVATNTPLLARVIVAKA
jgi:demethylspheroidene O-methyltransferase